MVPQEDEEEKDVFDQVGAFFRRSSTKLKIKYAETDFKGGAKDLGKSISETSKSVGNKMTQGIKEIKAKEKSINVKKGFMNFATKVKGLFGSPNQ